MQFFLHEKNVTIKFDSNDAINILTSCLSQKATYILTMTHDPNRWHREAAFERSRLRSRAVALHRYEHNPTDEIRIAEMIRRNDKPIPDTFREGYDVTFGKEQDHEGRYGSQGISEAEV